MVLSQNRKPLKKPPNPVLRVSRFAPHACTFVPIASPKAERAPLADVALVPPLSMGSAVPLRLIARVPLEVMGEPEMDRNDGTVAATLVTVPVPAPLAVSVEPVRVNPLPIVTLCGLPLELVPQSFELPPAQLLGVCGPVGFALYGMVKSPTD